MIHSLLIILFKRSNCHTATRSLFRALALAGLTQQAVIEVTARTLSAVVVTRMMLYVALL